MVSDELSNVLLLFSTMPSYCVCGGGEVYGRPRPCAGGADGAS